MDGHILPEVGFSHANSLIPGPRVAEQKVWSAALAITPQFKSDKEKN
jgi:hypothetical protein